MNFTRRLGEDFSLSAEMTVGNELLGRFDRDEAFPLREVPPADRE
jgi:hypothetical protein